MAANKSVDNPFSLAGKTILITGGTQGVGGAISRAVAQAGADLVIHGLRDDAAAQATLSDCRSFGRRVDLLCGDLIPHDLFSSAQPLIDALWESSLFLNPDINCLVNNAGTYLDAAFLDTPTEIYYRTFQLNVASHLFMTRAAAKHWIAKQIPGRVVFTGSINGLLAERHHVYYDASKGAVAAMVRSLCAELAPLNIRVNSMAPGLVVTPMTGILQKDTNLCSWMEMHTPNRQVPMADVCGPPTVFLLSDAAQHVHGQTLYVDGGMSAWQQPDPPPTPTQLSPAI